MGRAIYDGTCHILEWDGHGERGNGSRIMGDTSIRRYGFLALGINGGSRIRAPAFNTLIEGAMLFAVL
jgi:hypothetical protein